MYCEHLLPLLAFFFLIIDSFDKHKFLIFHVLQVLYSFMMSADIFYLRIFKKSLLTQKSWQSSSIPIFSKEKNLLIQIRYMFPNNRIILHNIYCTITKGKAPCWMLLLHNMIQTHKVLCRRVWDLLKSSPFIIYLLITFLTQACHFGVLTCVRYFLS